MRRLTRLIYDDMRPALGVTEPGAIAFAVATARKYVKGTLREIHVKLNSGMYKNAFTCGIPNSTEVSNLHCAALGYVAADAGKGLECLDGVGRNDNLLARRLVREGKVRVEMDGISSEISITATVTTDADTATVSIRGAHTNITRITHNGREVGTYNNERQPGITTRPTHKTTDIHRYSLRQLLSYVRTVPVDEIDFIGKAYDLNLALFESAVKSRRTTITRQLYARNGSQTISSDEHSTAVLLCTAAIEARVLGLPLPAMSITGSGAHGIIATLPLYATHRVGGASREQLLRATALSYLVCMYIKEYSGRLSAFCGCAIAAGTGMACALAWLRGGKLRELTLTIQNMASSVTGMICDGGNHGCALKALVAVDAAYRAADLAANGIAIDKAHGINGLTPEDTMRNMGLIASPGMVETEGTIVDIMRRKGSAH